MHDIGRTQAEYWTGEMGMEAGEAGYVGEFGAASAYEYPPGEYSTGYPGEYSPEYLGEQGSYEAAGLYGEGEGEGEGEGLFNEADEMALATELLGVSSEDELDRFIGDLLRKASRAVGSALSSPVGKALGGMIKSVAKQALPMVGGALGNIVMPGVGGVMGSQLASGAGQIFGLELGGLSQEDQDFQAARRVVRLTGAAVENAVTAPPGSPPAATARVALETAAQTHAPGLITPPNWGYGNGPAPSQQSGRWFRRGSKIVLVGV